MFALKITTAEAILAQSRGRPPNLAHPVGRAVAGGCQSAVS